jgi:hypothetical protein
MDAAFVLLDAAAFGSILIMAVPAQASIVVPVCPEGSLAFGDARPACSSWPVHKA